MTVMRCFEDAGCTWMQLRHGYQIEDKASVRYINGTDARDGFTVSIDDDCNTDSWAAILDAIEARYPDNLFSGGAPELIGNTRLHFYEAQPEPWDADAPIRISLPLD